METRRERIDAEHRYKLGLLREVVSKHGWSEVRAKKKYRGVNLFGWVRLCRAAYKNDRIRDFLVPELESIPGWSWDPRRDQMRAQVDSLRTFIRNHGWNAITGEAQLEGVHLGHWCMNRRMEHRAGTLAPWIVRALDAIPGWSWEPRDEHLVERIERMREYVSRHGWENFGLGTIDRYGVRIGKWANHIRLLHRRGALPAWAVAELESIDGWLWEMRKDKQRVQLEALRRYIQDHGIDAVTTSTEVDGLKIGRWLYNCLDRDRRQNLSAFLQRELASLPGWSRRRASYRKRWDG